MITGYNANIAHGGRVFHVQTEDSGRAYPHVITHLYFEGTILASERRDYAELVDAPDVAERVRRLMEEQHAAVVERLRRGEFDAVIASRLSRPAAAANAASADPEVSAVPRGHRASRPPAAKAAADRPAEERPLDDAILEYLIAKSRERSRRGRGSRSDG